jgi:serine protease Do
VKIGEGAKEQEMGLSRSNRKSLWSRVATIAVAATVVYVALMPQAHAAVTLSDQDAMERAAAITEPSIVRITAEWRIYLVDEEGHRSDPIEIQTSCSGFVVDSDGYIVTAGHCVDGSTEYGGVGYDVIESVATDYYQKNQQRLESSGYTLQDVIDYGLKNWTIEGEDGGVPTPDLTIHLGGSTESMDDAESFVGKIVDFDPVNEGDVALLKVDAHGLPALELADPEDISIGMSVYSIGFPGIRDEATDKSMSPTFKDGTVSDDSASRNDGEVNLYEISAPMSQGMSGGPTVDLNGRVIGLNSLGFVSEDFSWISTQDEIREVLERNGVDGDPSAGDRSFRDGLDAFYAGDYETAESEFRTTLEATPFHEQATSFLERAQEGEPATTAPETSELPLELLTGLTGLAIAGVVLTIMGRQLARRDEEFFPMAAAKH